MKKKIIILLPDFDFEHIANNFCYNLIKNNFNLKIYKITNFKKNFYFIDVFFRLIFFLERSLLKKKTEKKIIKINYINSFDELFENKNNNFDIFINLTRNQIKRKHLKLKKSLYLSLFCFDNNLSYRAGIAEVLNKKDDTHFSIELKSLDHDTRYYNNLNNTLNSFFLNKIELIQNNFNQLYTIIEDTNINLFKFKKKVKINKDKISLVKLLNFFTVKIYHTIFGKQLKWTIYFESNSKKKYFSKYNLSQATKISNIKSKYLGDPFLFKKGNENFLFAEEFDLKEKKGHIVSFQLSNYNNSYIRQGTVLKEKFHLSFPYIFKDNKKIYMIPESSENNDVRLYECLKFPFKWKLKKILFKNIKAVDTIAFKKRNIWFLITTTAINSSDQFNKIDIFYSVKGLLTNDWIRNRSSLTQFNNKNVRNAGLVKIKNDLFRINQIPSFNNYGHKIQINKIININKNIYEEKKIKEISINFFNNRKIYGTHHLSINNEFIAYDIKD